MSRFKIIKEKKLVLAHPWNSQRDNKFSPRSSCNVTSLQVALSLDFSITDDELFQIANSEEIKNIIKQKYPKDTWILNFFTKKTANEVWVVLVETAIKIIGDARFVKFHQTLTRELIISEINKGYPVIICGKFTGGHFITIVGYDLEKNVWIVNDSWGDWNTGYKIVNGNNAEYSMEKLIIGSFLNRMAILIHADKRIIT